MCPYVNINARQSRSAIFFYILSVADLIHDGMLKRLAELVVTSNSNVSEGLGHCVHNLNSEVVRVQ